MTIQFRRGHDAPRRASIELSVGDSDEAQALRTTFDEVHCIKLERLIAGDLLDEVASGVAGAEYYTREHAGISKEACMVDNATLALLVFLVNDPRFFDVIEQVTGCGPIGWFDGRVYRISRIAGHYDSWHDDLGDNRMIAMSLNLSTIAYAGGVLQIRDRDSKRVLHEAANVGLGDAVIFRLSERLQHQIGPVEGHAAKTAFAGWFKSGPRLLSAPQEQRTPLQRASG